MTPADNRFRVSLYATICMATIGMWMGEDDPAPYPLLVILCTVGAYAFIDQGGRFAIPPRVAPWLGFLAIAAFVREELANYSLDPVMPLGHLLVYLQLIVLFHRKTPRLYWGMVLMAFLQMAIAAIHNNSVRFGVLLCVYLATTLWTLTQFLLVREADRARPSAVDANLPPRLGRSLVGSLVSCLAILAVALGGFLAFPRRGQTAWTQSRFGTVQHLTGFDEQIRLGQLGTILESDDEVMTIHLYDENGQQYKPTTELLWRGVTMTRYQEGRWQRGFDVRPVTGPWSDSRPNQYVRIEISLQSVSRNVLFALRPTLTGYTRDGTPLDLVRRDGSLIRPADSGSGPIQYILEADMDDRMMQRGEHPTAAAMNDTRLVQVPGDLVAPLRDYVARLGIRTDNPQLLAQQLVDHLQNPAEFSYTLNASVQNPDVDPVLDFLLFRKEGHCEYYASALALLLRVHGVPARVVNGFKGGDWNALIDRFLVVRQKHAHSWVEAIVSTPDQPQPHWITLDPTPNQGRQQMVAMVNPTPSLVRQVGDFSRQVWSRFVLNFNAGEQDAVLYSPVRRVAQQVLDRAEEMRTTLLAPRRFNWIAAIVSGSSMAALLGMVWAASVVLPKAGPTTRTAGRAGLWTWLKALVRDLFDRLQGGRRLARPHVAFYDRLLQILESHGFEKQVAATPRQFAEEVGQRLAGSNGAAAVAQVPSDVVVHFYRVRFGARALSRPELDRIEQSLDSLSAALRQRSRASDEGSHE
jgi:hypothetical protein